MWVYIWLAVFAVTLVLEFVTLDLVSGWISVGAIVSLILAVCGVPYEIQLVVCAGVAILCIVFLRKLALKYLYKEKGKTNLELAIGTKVKLLTDCINDEKGTAKYNGVVWSVVTDGDEDLHAGDYAEILRIEGNKLIVKGIKNKESKKEN